MSKNEHWSEQLKHSLLAVKWASEEGGVDGILQEAKSYHLGSFLKSCFGITGILLWIFPLLTLITNHNQFGLIQSYKNFHLEWPLCESKFISKQSSHNENCSLILRGSQRRIAVGNGIAFAAEMPLVVPAWILWSCQRTGINNVTPGLRILLFSWYLPSKGTAVAHFCTSGILLGKGVCKPVYHHPISQSRKHRPLRSSWVPEQYLREEYSSPPYPSNTMVEALTSKQI